MKSARHPYHDDVAAELRSWFTNSAPEIDYSVTRNWFGYLANSESPMGTRLILDIKEPEEIADALGEARAQCAHRDITIWVDSHSRHTSLDGALRNAGAEPIKATTHIALVGELTSVAAELEFEEVAANNLATWADTKIRAFDNVESQPSAERLAAELAVRGPELALADLTLARLIGEPVGVSAFYRGTDQLLFNLGTRAPFRHHGVAQALIARWVHQGLGAGCRSLIINADDPGAPQDLYRHMGFVDEVYWYQSYKLAAEGSPIRTSGT